MNKQKLKNVFLVLLTLMLTAAIAAVATYAFRDRAAMQSVENTFTNGNVTIGLYQCAWDGVLGPNDSSYDRPAKDSDLGMYVSQRYTQGIYIPKNPRIANISEPDATGLTPDELIAWVGIKAEFYTIIEETDAQGNVSQNVYQYTGRQFDENIAEIYLSGQNGDYVKVDYDTDYRYLNNSWEADDGWNEFYYRIPVYNKQSSNELFHWLKPVVLSNTTDEDGEKMYIIPVFDENGVKREVLSYSKPDFDVDIKAYAIQYQMSDGKDFDEANVKQKLHILMNYQANMNNGG